MAQMLRECMGLDLLGSEATPNDQNLRAFLRNENNPAHKILGLTSTRRRTKEKLDPFNAARRRGKWVVSESEPQGERRSSLCKTVLHLTKIAGCRRSATFPDQRSVSRKRTVSTRPQPNCLKADSRFGG